MAERRPIAGFHFDRRKTWPFMFMLVAVMAIGLGRVWTYGLAQEWSIALILVGMPALAFVMVGQQLRLPAPAVQILEEGLLDLRHGPRPVPWNAIQQATIRRRIFNKGIRIVLTNGERYDIEMNLLAAEPLEVMRHIQAQAAQIGSTDAR